MSSVSIIDAIGQMTDRRSITAFALGNMQDHGEDLRVLFSDCNERLPIIFGF